MRNIWYNIIRKLGWRKVNIIGYHCVYCKKWVNKPYVMWRRKGQPVVSIKACTECMNSEHKNA